MKSKHYQALGNTNKSPLKQTKKYQKKFIKRVDMVLYNHKETR